ncbi:MAG TPA: lysophospholipid acyltransferase family protein [Bryobacteraceae bacterium]|nr:lysophospholipid acyltransferase family protein [Bryobacteraceae bacterium]
MSFALLRTLLWTDPLIVLSTALMGTLNLFVALVDKNGDKQFVMARIWSQMLVRIMGMRMEVTGLENLEPGRHYIFAGNHRSYSDTPALLSTLPGNFRFMAKDGLFKIPLMGHHLKLAGHIPVSLVNPREALRSLNRAAEMIKERAVSVLIFPEGGRTEGELEPFKEGAAIIGIKSGVPIVPFGLVGTRDVLPMHGVAIRGGVVRVHVGKPIPTEGLVFKNKTELTERVRNEVAALLGVEP